MRVLLLIEAVALIASVGVNVVLWYRLREVRLSVVRRKRLKAAQAQRDGFADALVEIEAAAHLWRDVDSPLATKVREILSRTESRNHTRKES